MARQPKIGLDYAGWNTDIFENDTKIDMLIDAQGWIGFAIYFYLCQKAYASDGYFYRWSYANSATTARKMGDGIRSETVRAAVGTCSQVGLFDKRLLDVEGILTSKGIQRRYVEAIQKRRVKAVNKTYWLLDENESSGVVFIPESSDLRNKNSDLQTANPDLQTENFPKSKVKESKVKESKEKSIECVHTPTSKPSISELIDQTDFSNTLKSTVKDWASYKTEKRQGYKEVGFKKLLTEIGNRINRHGEKAVIDVINLSMSNNWQGIIWDRIKETKGTENDSKFESLREWMNE